MDNVEFTPAREYIRTVEAMGSLFDFWNQRLFGGALEKPVITVCQDRRGRACGWFVPSRIWKKDAEDRGYPEINMCAQYLSREFEKTAETMLHEMVHLYAFLHEIADTSSNGRYHNREYKRLAEEFGLKVTKSASHGYSMTELTDDSKKLLEEFDGVREYLFDTRPRASSEDFVGTAEREAKAKRPPVARFTYVCPGCGRKIKGYTNAPDLLCATCKVPFAAEIK